RRPVSHPVRSPGTGHSLRSPPAWPSRPPGPVTLPLTGPATPGRHGRPRDGSPGRQAGRDGTSGRGGAAVVRGGPVRRSRDVRVRLTPAEHAAWTEARERTGRRE